MVFHELSRTRKHNLLDGRRMPQRAVGIYERDPEWREERKRRQQLSVDHGRIGYVGNQAPALEGTTIPPP